MKKILLMAIMAVVCLEMEAQTLDFSEDDVDGRHFVIDEIVSGSDNLDIPTSIHFNDDGTCTYTTRKGTLECSAFWVGKHGKIIHFFSQKDYDGNDIPTILNIRTGGYVNGRLRLRSYNNEDWSIRLRIEESASVLSVDSDAGGDKATYNLQGVRTQHPQGVYIQSGKKLLSR